MNRPPIQHPAVAARRHRLRKQRGFSMIEVLVTVLILAIGLLGLAGLQSTSLRSNHSAMLRSQATVLAYDIADRLRANRTAALNGNYDVDLEETPTGTSMVATDIIAWKTNLAEMLPLGDGAIERDDDDNRFTITVQWDDSRGEEDPKVFTLRTDL
jgi:type IV pilus assembly protein PilV